MGHINETLEVGFDGNTSILSNNFFDAGPHVVPQGIVYLYLAFISLGAVISLINFLALLTCRKNGALTLIMQLSIVDFVSPYVAAVEILTLNDQVWILPSDNCPLFNGVEVLVNSLVIWLIVCLNFHVISIWNLYKNEVDKKTPNPLTSCEESNECLVTKQENANRTMNIDYRKRRSDISVILPVTLIVFVCFSLSIPNFALSSTLKVNRNHTICTIMDNFYGYTVQKLLILFRVVVPTPLLLLTLIILVLKLVQTSPKDIDNILIQKYSEIRGFLVCCISITIFYIGTTFQRNILHLLHIIAHDLDENTTVIFKIPPLYNDTINESSNVYLSMLHYSGITSRALLYIFALPKYQNIIKSKVFVFCKAEQ